MSIGEDETDSKKSSVDSKRQPTHFKSTAHVFATEVKTALIKNPPMRKYIEVDVGLRVENVHM